MPTVKRDIEYRDTCHLIGEHVNSSSFKVSEKNVWILVLNEQKHLKDLQRLVHLISVSGDR